jgi:hypothetical protein
MISSCSPKLYQAFRSKKTLKIPTTDAKPSSAGLMKQPSYLVWMLVLSIQLSDPPLKKCFQLAILAP